MLALFEVSTLSQWDSVMLAGIDAAGVWICLLVVGHGKGSSLIRSGQVDKQPVLDNSKWIIVYYVAFVVTGRMLELSGCFVP